MKMKPLITLSITSMVLVTSTLYPAYDAQKTMPIFNVVHQVASQISRRPWPMASFSSSPAHPLATPETKRTAAKESISVDELKKKLRALHNKYQPKLHEALNTRDEWKNLSNILTAITQAEKSDADVAGIRESIAGAFGAAGGSDAFQELDYEKIGLVFQFIAKLNRLVPAITNYVVVTALPVAPAPSSRPEESGRAATAPAAPPSVATTYTPEATQKMSPLDYARANTKSHFESLVADSLSPFYPLHHVINRAAARNLKEVIHIIANLLRHSPVIVNEKWVEMTPVMLAARSNQYDIVHILLNHGADIRIKDDKRRDAVDHAASPDMRTFLEGYEMYQDALKELEEIRKEQAIL